MLNIACGFLYGLFFGLFCLIIYAAIGLSFSFMACRFILRHDYWIIKNLKNTFDRSPIIQTLVKILNSADGYKIIFLSRLTPVGNLKSFLFTKRFDESFFFAQIPLGLQNGFYSVSNVAFGTYLFWSICGLMPTQFIYCVLGSRLHSMTDLILIDKRTKAVGIVVGLCECLMTIVLTYYVCRTAKKALNKIILETNSSNENLIHIQDRLS